MIKLYYLRALITSEYVHCIASNNKEKFPKTAVFKLFEGNQSEDVRRRLIDQVSNKK